MSSLGDVITRKIQKLEAEKPKVDPKTAEDQSKSVLEKAKNILGYGDSGTKAKSDS
jgi:hypothetical protein